ncbi:hypothetical protein [Dankookia sp. P2]|uniref:hypothetical protein n=1 Tax=Dankookia sp. P2 TaxID=3423955 RepID=UPI003D66C2AA
MSWALTLAGPENAGRVTAWGGMAMFAALALGAPVGTTLYAVDGVPAIAASTTLVPFAAIALVVPLASIPPQHGTRPAILKVARVVWLLFSAFAASLVAARLFLGHVPDRLSGARVALAPVPIEAAGLALI